MQKENIDLKEKTKDPLPGIYANPSAIDSCKSFPKLFAAGQISTPD